VLYNPELLFQGSIPEEGEKALQQGDKRQLVLSTGTKYNYP